MALDLLIAFKDFNIPDLNQTGATRWIEQMQWGVNLKSGNTAHRDMRKQFESDTLSNPYLNIHV